ncbi:MAG: hypothetical protein U1E65_13370 [Myxococcota bacterium]
MSIRTTPLLLLALTASAGTAEARSFLKPLALSSDNYGESYSFIADLEDGGYLLLQLGVSNVGPGSGHGICRALYVAANAGPWTANTIVGSGDWGFKDEGGEERLSIGPCDARIGKDATTIRVPLEGARMELKIEGRPASIMPPGAHMKIAGGQHRSEIWFPAAKAEATIQPKDGEAKQVKGVAYGDHSCSDVDPGKIAKRWVRFRALRAEVPVLILGREDPSGAFGPVWMRSGADFSQLTRYEVARSGDKAKPALTINLSAGDKKLEIKSERFLFRYAPVEEIGAIGSIIAPFVGAPTSFTMRATLTDGDKKIPGLLEVEYAKDE